MEIDRVKVPWSERPPSFSKGIVIGWLVAGVPTAIAFALFARWLWVIPMAGFWMAFYMWKVGR